MILFFDTETTGIRDWKNPTFLPRVVQIGALLTDNEGKTLAELNVLLYPEGFDTVPEVAANVHGFSFEMISKTGINRELGLETFFEIMDKADIIVAHNIEYDLDLLNIEIDYAREHAENQFVPEAWAEVLNSKQAFCTMLNSRDLLKLPLSAAQASFFKDKGIDQQYKNPRLSEAYQHYFGKTFDNAHDAMADVRACADVYFKLHSLKEEVTA